MKTLKCLIFLLFLFLFSSATSAQTGDTGTLEIERLGDYVCWDSAGTSVTLSRVRFFSLGENNNDPILTKYYNAVQEVTPTAFSIGQCVGATSSTDIEVSLLEMCDFDSINNKVFPYLQVHKLIADATGIIVDTIELIDYKNNPYDPVGQQKVGHCSVCVGSSNNSTPATTTIVSNQMVRITTENDFCLNDNYLSYSIQNTGWTPAQVTDSNGNISTLYTGQTYSCSSQFDYSENEYTYCSNVCVTSNNNKIHYTYKVD